MNASFVSKILLTAVLAALPASSLNAQNSSAYPPGPVPNQVYSARKVFISNADAEVFEGKPNVAYAAFYAGIKTWQTLQIASTPSDGDLIFEVSYTGGPAPRIYLTILDPKTHVVLWKLYESVGGWGRDATGRKNFDRAMNSVLADVKALMTPPPSTAATP